MAVVDGAFLIAMVGLTLKSISSPMDLGERRP